MWNDNETKQDLLGYQVHADLLKRIILNDSMLPISIGVFGNWGSGKSSLMLLLQQGIEQWKSDNKGQKVLQVCFNSWQFEGYESTKLTMIDTILKALNDDIASNKSVFDKADDFIKKIKVLKVGVFVLKKAYENVIPDFVKKWLPTKEELDEITGDDEYNNLMSEISDGNTSTFISTFRKLFSKLISDANYKAVVVYIDDLDRCDPKRIIECLEAVKLFVNVDNTAFVIGADERIIEHAIELHYPIKQKKEEISSPFSDYLEKLIQLPYKLPRLSDNEQETYITLLLCKNALTDIEFNDIHKKYQEFRLRDKHSKYDISDIKNNSPKLNLGSVDYMLPVVPLMKQFLNGNPRQIKRFLNTLYVRKELANVAGFESIKPDILVKLMVLEYNTLYSFRFEELYKLQRQNNGVIPIETAEKEAITEEGIQDPLWKEHWSSEYLTNWIASPPSLVNIPLENYFWVARDALKNEKPVASRVTNKVNLVFKQLISIQSQQSMTKRLPKLVESLESDEQHMLIYLINNKLRTEPDSSDCWRILNADKDNLIIQNDIDRLNLLLENVATDQISPQADTFFTMMLSIEGAIKNKVQTLPKAKKLDIAINRKLAK